MLPSGGTALRIQAPSTELAKKFSVKDLGVGLGARGRFRDAGLP